MLVYGQVCWSIPAFEFVHFLNLVVTSLIERDSGSKFLYELFVLDGFVSVSDAVCTDANARVHHIYRQVHFFLWSQLFDVQRRHDRY